jgi:hypothetical protein
MDSCCLGNRRAGDCPWPSEGETASASWAASHVRKVTRERVGGCTYAFVWTVVVVWRAEVSNRILKMWEEVEP